MKKTFETLFQAGKSLVLVGITALALTFAPAPAGAQDNAAIDVNPLAGIPLLTSHSATNGNTNFSSEAINPEYGKDLTFWLKVRGTNATSSGTQVWSLFGAPDTTNFQSTALTTMTMTYNGTNWVIKPFFLAWTNFAGFNTLKFGSITNVSTNRGEIGKAWVVKPKVAPTLAR